MASHTSLDDATDRRDDDSPAIHADDLTLSYGGDPVVDTETLVVPEGEVTALVGPNGSGKSTLLKGLSRELAPDAGVVHLDGRDVREYGTKELARELGLLAQHNDAPGDVTVETLVEHGRYPHRGPFEGLSTDDYAAIDRAIDLAGVDHLRERPVSDLSGGQRQLAFVAMALAQDTDVLLLDEPTTYLDLHHQLRVMEVVHTLNEERGVTVCVVLHDLQQAARFADYLLALDGGRVYDWGPPAEVVTEELLADVFGVAATVSFEAGAPRIVPRGAIER